MTETRGISPNTMITNTQNNTQSENYITQRQADVLDQTRLRAPNTVLRYSNDGKIVSLLLNLKSLGKADLAVKFVCDRLKHLAKYVNLDDPSAVNLFIARKR